MIGGIWKDEMPDVILLNKQTKFLQFFQPEKNLADQYYGFIVE